MASGEFSLIGLLWTLFALVLAATHSKKADVVEAIPVAPAEALDDGDDIVAATTSFYAAEDGAHFNDMLNCIWMVALIVKWFCSYFL